MDIKKPPLRRSRSNKMIAGVCAGIADWLGWDPTVVRIGFVLLSILSAAIHFAKKLLPRKADVRQKGIETSLIERFLYPKLGPGQMIAADLPAKWMWRMNHDFLEAKMFLCTQIMDEARHSEVFRKRALANGGGLTQDELVDLLQRVTGQGIGWAHVEKLQEFDGEPAFTKAQGED